MTAEFSSDSSKRSTIGTRLALTLALYTVVTALLVGLIIGCFQVWSNLQDRKLRANESIEAIISSTKPSIALATFNFSSNLNQQLINGLAAHPEIINATIIDTKGRNFVIAENPQFCKGSSLTTILYGSSNQRTYPLNYQDTDLGRLVIELNSCHLTNMFYQEIKTTLASSLILSIIIALFIFIIFYQLVSLPLSRLLEKIQQVNPAEIDFSTLQKFNSHRNDEIGSLINHFADLLHTTYEHINRLRAAEHTINNYSVNLEELVSKRTQAITGINHQLKEANQKLELSQKLSDQFNQSQFKLLKGLSQELRTPINTNLGVLQDALPNCNNAADHSRIESLISQSDIIISILDELNDIADLKNNFETKQSSPFSLKDTLHNLEQEIRYQEANLIIDIQIDKSLSSGHIGNSQLIKTLLFNLIANIFQCTKSSLLKVHLTESNQSVLITFSAQDLYVPESYFDVMILPLGNPLAHSNITTLGLGFAKDLTELLSGQIKLSSNSQNEHLMSLLLPLPSSDVQLAELCNKIPEGGIRVDIQQQLLTNLVTSALSKWDLPFNLASVSSNKPVLLITDQLKTGADTCCLIGIGKIFKGKECINDIPLIVVNNFDEGYLFSAINQACLVNKQEQTQHQLTKILLVDDNAINRMLSHRFLKKLNTDIEMVVNGQEAVEACNGKKFDLIFMDCNMPVMDGYTATKQIRRSYLNQHTPIIALSGMDAETDRQACLQAGMNDFIAKPYTQEQLHNAITQWLPDNHI